MTNDHTYSPQPAQPGQPEQPTPATGWLANRWAPQNRWATFLGAVGVLVVGGSVFAIVLGQLLSGGGSGGPYDSKDELIKAAAKAINAGDAEKLCRLHTSDGKKPLDGGNEHWGGCVEEYADDLRGQSFKLSTNSDAYDVESHWDDDSERRFGEVSWYAYDASLSITENDAGWWLSYVDLD